MDRIFPTDKIHEKVVAMVTASQLFEQWKCFKDECGFTTSASYVFFIHILRSFKTERSYFILRLRGGWFLFHALLDSCESFI